MEYKAKLISVIDGDTVDLEVFLGLGFYCHCRIRLVGIDAPEIFGVSKYTPDYTQGLMAMLEVKKWFASCGSVVNLTCEHKDIYGRVLGVIVGLDSSISLNDFMRDKYGFKGHQPLYTQEPVLKCKF